MIKNSIYLAAALLLAGCLTVSCTKDPKDAPVDPRPEGMGYLSLNIPLEQAARSRAVTTSYGIDAEYNLNSIRIILYNAAGIAQHVESYLIEYDSDEKTLTFKNLDETNINDDVFLSQEGAYGNTIEVPDDRSELVITRLPFEVPVMDYQVVVLFNYLNFGGDNEHTYVDGSQPANMWLYESTGKVGHNINILQTPMDLYQDWELSGLSGYATPYEYALNGINKITGLNAQTLGYMGQINTLHMFMSNADGIVRISAADLKASMEESPVEATINVDRALAKVILQKGEDFGLNTVDGYLIPSGKGKVKDIAWVPDVLNFRIYPMRQSAQTAPSNNFAAETPATDRALRYAKDPNWDGYSSLRTGEWYSPEQDFAYMPQDPIQMQEIYYPGLLDVFEKTWWDKNTHTLSDYLWYYVPENTMQADEQWEDVTTSVVFRCQYIPSGWSVSEVTANGFYYFQGYVLKHSQIIEYLADDSKIPPVISDLKEVLAIWKNSGYFRGSNTPPSYGISESGLSYYRDGVNYYRIPIRHFDDTQSPDLMGYGRYGVVRNNVYTVVVEDILGPGSPQLPPPDGPDDKETNVKTTISIKEWIHHNLSFDF